MSEFLLQNKTAITAPQATAIMPVHILSGGNWLMRHITQANLFASPLPIGSTTPNTGAFTTISASGLITATGGLAGLPVSTFTPTLYGTTTAGTPTLTTATGRAVNLGNWIAGIGQLAWSDLGGAVGNMRVGGLPFTCRSGVSSRGFFKAFYYNSLSLTNAGLGGFVEQNQSYITLLTESTTTAATLVTDTQLTATGEFNFFFLYERA